MVLAMASKVMAWEMPWVCLSSAIHVQSNASSMKLPGKQSRQLPALIGVTILSIFEQLYTAVVDAGAASLCFPSDHVVECGVAAIEENAAMMFTGSPN